jgi:predicted DNA-binding transcriptional regulator AlpA
MKDASDAENDDRLITVEELAKRLGYTVKWVLAQMKAGVIPVIRFSARAWRYHWPTVLPALNRR